MTILWRKRESNRQRVRNRQREREREKEREREGGGERETERDSQPCHIFVISFCLNKDHKLLHNA